MPQQPGQANQTAMLAKQFNGIAQRASGVLHGMKRATGLSVRVLQMVTMIVVSLLVFTCFMSSLLLQAITAGPGKAGNHMSMAHALQTYASIVALVTFVLLVISSWLTVRSIQSARPSAQYQPGGNAMPHHNQQNNGGNQQNNAGNAAGNQSPNPNQGGIPGNQTGGANPNPGYNQTGSGGITPTPVGSPPGGVQNVPPARTADPNAAPAGGQPPATGPGGVPNSPNPSGIPGYVDPNAPPGMGHQQGMHVGPIKLGGDEARKERERARKLEDSLRETERKLEAAQRERDAVRTERDNERRMRELLEGRYKYLQERLKDGKIVQPDPPEADPPGYEVEKKFHPHQRTYPATGPAASLAGGWHLTGASVRGRSHKAGKFRDDEFHIRLGGTDKIALVAIADGVGSKEFSRMGAYAAVHGAVDSVKEEQMSALVTAVLKNQDPEETAITQQAKQMIHGMLDHAYQAVLQTAEQNKKHPDELHSTLLVYVLVPRANGDLFVASAQVGDGALLAWQPTAAGAVAADLNFLQQPQFTGVDNRVVPFLRFNKSEWKNIIKVSTVEKGQVLLGMTDGTIDDLSTPPDEVTGHFADFADFYNKIKAASLDTDAPGQGMATFLEYRKRASGDDRTVVCTY